MIRSLRDEALLVLEGRGAILEVAREVTCIMGDAGINGAVIGGVAVVLHGYVRTTADVDVYVPGHAADLAAALKSAGFAFDRARREFIRGNVPVHFVLASDLKHEPTERVAIDGVHTVGLADLLNMKLESGLRDPLRAIDIADVIGLIRCHGLSPSFAAKLARGVRTEFRKLARAVARSG